MRVLTALTVAAFSCTCFAEDSISSADHILKLLVGKRILAEGLAWGAYDKGIGERIVLPSGDKLYLTGKDYIEKHPNGKLIRLIGVLSVKTQKAIPTKYHQGYGQEFQYYAVKVESFELIDKLEHAFPKILMTKSMKYEDDSNIKIEQDKRLPSRDAEVVIPYLSQFDDKKGNDYIKSILGQPDDDFGSGLSILRYGLDDGTFIIITIFHDVRSIVHTDFGTGLDTIIYDNGHYYGDYDSGLTHE